MSDDVRQAEGDVCIVLLRALYTGVDLTDEQLRSMAKDFVQASYKDQRISGMHFGDLSRQLVKAIREGDICRVTFTPLSEK